MFPAWSSSKELRVPFQSESLLENILKLNGIYLEYELLSEK